MSGNAFYFGIIVLALAVFAVGPIFTITAITTLFHAGIPIDFGTWAAACWLQFALTARFSANRE